MVMKKDHNSEFEVKLIVTSQQPRKIANSLRKLTRLGDYRLTNRKLIKIQDIYFDTGTDRLRKSQLALRVRLMENKKLLTMKGKAAFADWGGIKRLEIEETWSVALLQKVLEKIPNFNFNANDLSDLFLPDNPVKTLMKLNFKVIQDRITHRELKDVMMPGHCQSVADFVLDEVRFQTTAGKVIHYEVEIEALAEKSVEHVHIILKELQNRYPDDLLIWLYSKLETGEIIAQYTNDLQKNSFITEDGFIRKNGYKMIADLLHK
jgi:hypothetical protein